MTSDTGEALDVAVAAMFFHFKSFQSFKENRANYVKWSSRKIILFSLNFKEKLWE